ncbi:hypothetical protein [Streptomyces sp. NPDC006879]|uniref:hypothetical protein n=1 Tax=Streptomyces sp. NPDC006879 TaxID=3364767 RepID=UPI00368FE10F
MESPAESKQSAVLALAVIGVLLIGALSVFFFLDGDDGSAGDSGAAPSTATTGARDSRSGSGGSGAGRTAAVGDVPPVIEPAELLAAHQVMVEYLAGLNTYRYSDHKSAWASPLLALTHGDEALRKETALPSGREWANCRESRCSSRGEARVVRDAMIAEDLVRGSGPMVSSVVEVTAARSEDGRATGAETNSWLVSARKSGGDWKVSAFDLFGLGNVGASDQTGE